MGTLRVKYELFCEKCGDEESIDVPSNWAGREFVVGQRSGIWCWLEGGWEANLDERAAEEAGWTWNEEDCCVVCDDGALSVEEEQEEQEGSDPDVQQTSPGDQAGENTNVSAKGLSDVLTDMHAEYGDELAARFRDWVEQLPELVEKIAAAPEEYRKTLIDKATTSLREEGVTSEDIDEAISWYEGVLDHFPPIGNIQVALWALSFYSGSIPVAQKFDLMGTAISHLMADTFGSLEAEGNDSDEEASNSSSEENVVADPVEATPGPETPQSDAKQNLSPLERVRASREAMQQDVKARLAAQKAELGNLRAAAAKPSFCPSCGDQCDADARFCGECGTKIGA